MRSITAAASCNRSPPRAASPCTARAAAGPPAWRSRHSGPAPSASRSIASSATRSACWPPSTAACRSWMSIARSFPRVRPRRRTWGGCSRWRSRPKRPCACCWPNPPRLPKAVGLGVDAGRRAYALTLASADAGGTPSGDRQILYLDAESLALVGEASAGHEVRYGDLTTLSGLRFPQRMNLALAGKNTTVALHYKDLQLNPTIDPSMFVIRAAGRGAARDVGVTAGGTGCRLPDLAPCG